MGKNLPANAGDTSLTPGSGRSLERGMVTHSSVLARKFHRQRSLAGYRPWGCKELDTTERLTFIFFHFFSGGGNSLPPRHGYEGEIISYTINTALSN